MTKAPLITLGCVIAACALVYLSGGEANAHELTSRGLEALGRGNHGAAADDLLRAVGVLEAGTPEYDRARMGLVEALAHIEPDRARIEFLAYADEGADLATRDYLTVASTIHKSGGTSEAVQVLEAAALRFPERTADIALQIDTMVAQATAGGTPEEIERLESLGYVGR